MLRSLALLEGGVEAWNAYREDHPNFEPYLRNVNLSWTNRHLGSFEGINFSGADLSASDLTGVSLDDADLSGAAMEGVTLVDAGLNAADLSGAILRGADLNEAHLGFATFDGADMAFANLVDAELWNASLQGTSLDRGVLDGVEAGDSFWMGANLSMARLVDADLRGADLSGADLRYATLVNTDLRNANLQGAKVFGTSAWNLRLDGARQSDLVISDEHEGSITVDDIQVAQFVHLLLNHAHLRQVMNAVSDKGVLLLGRFGDGGHDVLVSLAEGLRKLGYLPMIFDFARPEGRSYTETVQTLAGLSRFVVADLSGPSVPLELHATVPNLKIPFVPIIEKGRQVFAMATDLLEYPWVVRPVVEFASVPALRRSLRAKIVRPAERLHERRQKLLAELFG